jgi:hypothetical protein
MQIDIQKPSYRRISTSPPGRGWKARPDLTVNADYVRKLLEENRLTERDETLFKYLDLLGVLSSSQIRRLVWSDSSLSNMHRRLRQLYNYHLLDRARMLAKEEGIIYALGKAGRIWLHGAEHSRGGGGPVVDRVTLAHDLTVAEVMVLLTEELRRLDPDQQQDMWLHWFNETEARVVRGDKVVLEPDGMVRVGIKQKYFAFYLEVDMGTERRAALEAKIRRYHEAYFQNGLRDENNILPYIIIVTATPDRAAYIAQIVAAFQKTRKGISLSWLTTSLPQLRADGAFNGVSWFDVQHDQITQQKLQLW